MRILNVTAQKPDSTGSGVYLLELMKGFHKIGHSQALIAGAYEEDNIDVPEDTAVFPIYFHTEKLPFAIAGMSDEMPYKSTRYCDMTPEMTEQFRSAYTEKIIKALHSFKPDVILCHHLYYVTALVRELSGEIPVYAVCHGSDLRQIKKNSWQREYIKPMLAKLDGIFALHQEQKEEICRIFPVSPAKVSVIGTGYNNEIFYKVPKIKEERCDFQRNGEIRIVFAGKISEKKGVMSLLRSVNLLDWQEKNYRLTLLGGHGNESEYRIIQDLAAQAKIPVELPGRVSQEQLVATMNKGDIFVLPSFYEGLPLVVVEAMACGLKVVCTDLPGIRPWLDTTVPNHNVVFVQPPVMENEDEPIKESLPEFEKELSEALRKQAQRVMAQRIGYDVGEEPDLSRVSWNGLCKIILDHIA